MKVALVHPWLVGMGDGERVLESLCELFPKADIFTLALDPDRISPRIARHHIETAFPRVLARSRNPRRWLALAPFALEAFDLGAYDLVLSNEDGPAKGIIPRPDATHICYCHAPLRQLWDHGPRERADAPWLDRQILRMVGTPLRQWDVTTAARVDHFIASSAYVARGIEKFYRRAATVIHPPLDLARHALHPRTGDYFLHLGPCPRRILDALRDAFSDGRRRLLIVGDFGRRVTSSATVTVLGPLGASATQDLLARCRALIHPVAAEFGTIPLRAMASGRPILALGQGGVTETVIPGRTGLFFREPTGEAIRGALEAFETIEHNFDPATIRAHAEQFDGTLFNHRLRDFIDARLRDDQTRARSMMEAPPPALAPRGIRLN